jgi:uncharacterized Zn-finger protein
MHIPSEEPTFVESERIACDGGALGHPRVFLTLPVQGDLSCPYCGKTYARAVSSNKAIHH